MPKENVQTFNQNSENWKLKQINEIILLIKTAN